VRVRYLLFSLTLAAIMATAGCDRLLHRSPGESLWREHCAKCHGLDGNGNTPGYMGETFADLRDDLWQAGGNDGAMEGVIRSGVFGKMPGYPQLTPEEVRAILDYIHVLRGESTSGTSS
jgi:mono/diheme cytochrome c family protein